LAENFVNEVQYAEAKFFWLSNHDGKHSYETYSLLIDTYVKDEAEKDELFNALEVFLLLRSRLGFEMD
jgi:ribonucleoside-diphosphate reductase beta chain